MRKNNYILCLCVHELEKISATHPLGVSNKPINTETSVSKIIRKSKSSKLQDVLDLTVRV